MDFTSINWRSRHYLPHFDGIGVQQHIVFGLIDALPGQLPEHHPDGSFEVLDGVLDRGRGACALADPRCAAIMQDELLHHDGARYRMLAWCIMPNHVHVVIEPNEGLAGILRRWKSWSARKINDQLERTGPLWRREYFDRFARNQDQLARMIQYVEANPVAAGLVEAVEDWHWSSAGHRRQT